MEPPKKASIQTFEDLYVYQLAREFRKSVSALAKKLPADERYNLTSQMRRAALSMTNNIAEGVGRYHYQENIQFCRQSRGSITELIDDLNACFDEGYIDRATSEEYKKRAYELIRVLNSYIASQKRRKT
ncbi:MAG: four helix bundle protein [Nitrospiraceae bacterium]